MQTDSPDSTPPTDARPAPPGRLRSLRARLRASRRRTRLAVGVAAVASAFALWPDPAPEPVALGAGRAGVHSAAAVSTPAAVAERAAPPAPDAAPSGDSIGGGEASYYADDLAGRPTASGEPHEPEALTAAHRSLPLGTRIRVTNLRTDESVVVRVNDRGPFAEHRVVDLSKAAARKIGMLRRGTARVRLELLPERGGVRG